MGNKRYFAPAEERVGGPIQAACITFITTRERFGGNDADTHLPFSRVLVLTTDELHVYALRREAGHRDGVLDTEMLFVPLGAIERLEHRRSFHPFKKVFRLTLTDGNQVTLQPGRGVNHGAAVIERLQDLIAAAPKHDPARDRMVIDRRGTPVARWRLLALIVGMSLFLFLAEVITRATGG